MGQPLDFIQIRYDFLLHKVTHTSPTEDFDVVANVVINGAAITVVKLFGFFLHLVTQ